MRRPPRPRAPRTPRRGSRHGPSYTAVPLLPSLPAATRPAAASLLLLRRPSSRPFTTSRPSPSPAAAATTPAAPVLSPGAANPPATTRPPPLRLPARDPSASLPAHLFATGKAYLAFYKTGLTHIYTNTRLVWALRTGSGAGSGGPTAAATAPSAAPRPPPGAATTRAAHLLVARWRHDVRRVPLFALLLVVCGELTPFAVLAFPGVVPLTCRIPRQVEQLLRRAEARRADAFRELAAAAPAAAGAPSPGEKKGGAGGSPAGLPPAVITRHIARSLSLTSAAWDRLPGAWPLLGPAVAARRARRAVRRLAQDDALLAQAGGAPALEPEELRLACAARGLDVRGRADADLRAVLGRWAALAAAGAGGGEAGRPGRVCALLLRRPEEWPAGPEGLELPAWEV